jgi:hypothetical protein
MAMYTPLPFVGKPLDQSEQQLRLVDLMYQAQLARIQREQEARLQGANMFMNLGVQLPQILNTVELNRIRQQQAEADVIRAKAYDQYMRDQAEAQRNEIIRSGQKAAYEATPGGMQIPAEGLAERFGPYAAGFEVTPLQDSVSERSVTPQESVSLASLMRPEMDARPVGTLPSRPMGVSVLPGMAVETPTEFGGFATKPKTKEQLAAEEATAKAEAAQAQIATLRQGMTPEQQRMFDMAQATRGMNLPGEAMSAMLGVAQPKTPQTLGQMEAEDARQWLEANPGKTLTDYRAMVASRTRAPREERPDGLTPNQEFGAIERLNASWRKDTDDVTVLANQYGAMRDAYTNLVNPKNKDNTEIRNVATQVIINGLNKMLDPNSVVREGEYARSEQGVAFLNKAQGWVNRLTRGGPALTDGELREFVSQAERLLGQRELTAGLDRKRDAYLKRAERFNIPADLLDFTNPANIVRVSGPSQGGAAGYGARPKP